MATDRMLSVIRSIVVYPVWFSGESGSTLLPAFVEGVRLVAIERVEEDVVVGVAATRGALGRLLAAVRGLADGCCVRRSKARSSIPAAYTE